MVFNHVVDSCDGKKYRGPSGTVRGLLSAKKINMSVACENPHRLNIRSYMRTSIAGLPASWALVVSLLNSGCAATLYNFAYE